MDNHASADLLVKVFEEFKDEFERGELPQGDE